MQKFSGERGRSMNHCTGESMPVNKNPKDVIIGGSVLIDGSLKAQVTASAKDSVLSNMIDLVKRAQTDKPKIQLLADRISAVFVPVVIGIALIDLSEKRLCCHDLGSSIMRSIAVFVIACPCAMGLATPAAIAVGLGRAARNGIFSGRQTVWNYSAKSTRLFLIKPEH